MSNELFKSIILGDEKAFEQVFIKHFKSMCFYGKLYGLSLEQSKEITQFTFLKFWEIRSQLEDRGPVENYLYKALRNNYIDYLRTKKIHQSYTEPLNLLTHDKLVADNHDFHEALIYEELEKKFKAALDAFPPQMKEIFILSRLEGLKYREIAEKLNLSVKTVETQMSRALSRLRNDLKDYLPFLLFIFLNCA